MRTHGAQPPLLKGGSGVNGGVAFATGGPRQASPRYVSGSNSSIGCRPSSLRAVRR